MKLATISERLRLGISLGLAALALGCGGGGGAPPPFGTSVTVSVSPSTVSVPLGGTQQFTATVTGSANTGVTWSVGGVTGGNSTVGTISSAGLYTAPNTVPTSGSVTVTATSSADTSKSDSATVTVTIPPVALLSISPIVAMQGTSAVTLTLTGNGFSPGSQVLFDNVARPATFVSATTLTAQLSSQGISQAGTFAVAVQSGSLTTSTLNFYVVPAINPQKVTVTGGAETKGTDVAVSSTPTPTLSLIAVGKVVGEQATAGSTGISLAPGNSVILFLVGKGIQPGTFYVISGNPADATVTQPGATDFTQTTDKPPIPAVTFQISVSSSAAPGARNILVTNPAGEIAAFVGGLLITQ